jgi:hypothetical protein
MGKMGIEKLSRGFDRQGQTRPKLIRGRDGPWDTGPGYLQSRWAPCGQAHEPGQGQAPFKTDKAPGNLVQHAPRSSAA